MHGHVRLGQLRTIVVGSSNASDGLSDFFFVLWAQFEGIERLIVPCSDHLLLLQDNLPGGLLDRLPNAVFSAAEIVPAQAQFLPNDLVVDARRPARLWPRRGRDQAVGFEASCDEGIPLLGSR